MALPRVTALLSVLALALPGLAEAGVTMSMREEPVVAPRSTSECHPGLAAAGGRCALQSRRAPLAWHGQGLLPNRRRRWLVGWRFARPEADDLPDLGSAEAKRARGWKLGNPFWTGKANRIQYRLVGEVDRLRVLPGAVGGILDAPNGCARDPSPDRPAVRLGRRRDDRSLGTLVCGPDRLCRRSSHRGRSALDSGAVGSDRPRDPALPRARERLERHRLQLPGRPVRPGLRGPRGRDHAERGRGARSGVQHRKRGGGCPRHLFLSRHRAARKGRARCSACLAA